MSETIEKLAEQLVLVDPLDLTGLAKAHSLFEALRNECSSLQAEWAMPLTKESANLLQDIIMEDAEDPEDALRQVVAAATALEQLILGQCDSDDIVLPDFYTGNGGQATESSAVSSNEGGSSRQDEESPGTSNEADTLGRHESNSSDAASSDYEAMEADNQEPECLTGDLVLIAEFITESCEHLETADECLLTIEEQPEDIETVNALFRAYHTIKGVAGFLDLGDVMRLAHQTENLLDAARQGRFRLEGARLDAVFDATDMMKRQIGFIADALSSGAPVQRDPNQAALIKLLTNLLDDSFVPDTSEAISTQATGNNSAEPTASGNEVIVQEPKSKQSKPAGDNPQTIQLRETVKVDSSRLDVMIDAIGELVIAEAMVTQSPKLLGLIDDDIERRFSHLSKITRELQEMATSLRLMPIRSTFQRMARLSRDTAKKLNKRIEFITSGDETELDKNVVDQIGDPLVHMVRNAVDHGLEDSEEQRIAAGKPAVGRVELRAFHKGGSIYIEIADDGAGLDRNKLINKAVERGIIQEEQKLTDQQAFQLIMEPGFSTAAQVSDVSGRGVGMDVVRKNIQKMRGQIEIQSTPGEGTTFSIRLPLTLAIIDGMVVRVANRRYVIPLLSITRMLRPDDTKLPTVFEQAEMLQTEEGLIPLHRIHRLFEIADAISDPTQASVVVVEHEGKRVGLMIDELLGQQQIVIKSLGESMRGLEGIAGGAIMPDGRVGLILDLDSLIRFAGSVGTEALEAA